MSSTTNSGIRKQADGTSYIPSSRRADGSTRKEIKVRPGFRPQEDIETYKTKNAEAWKTRGGGVPGVDNEAPVDLTDTKSKNAKRREAAKRKQAAQSIEGPIQSVENELVIGLNAVVLAKEDDAAKSNSQPTLTADGAVDLERQKKIRNQLKKLRAVQDLKAKKAAGEKLSPDQVMKMSKEDELIRDLKKIGYDGPELVETAGDETDDR